MIQCNVVLFILILMFLITVGTSEKNSRDGVQQAKIFFKSYSTKTKTLLSFFTSTVPFTCYSVDPAAVACVKRKRTLTLPTDLELENNDGSDSFLDSSIGNSDKLEPGNSRAQKKFFVTLWSTSSNTLTVTTFVTNRRLTLSVSVACTVPGVVLPFC